MKAATLLQLLIFANIFMIGHLTGQATTTDFNVVAYLGTYWPIWLGLTITNAGSAFLAGIPKEEKMSLTNLVTPQVRAAAINQVTRRRATLVLIAAPGLAEKMIVFLAEEHDEATFLQTYSNMFGGQPRVVAQKTIEHLPPAFELGRPFVG